MTNHLNPLPFQEQLSEILSQIQHLQEHVNQDSELGEALDRITGILDPHVGNVEWQEPISVEEMKSFRSYLSGMKI